MQLVPWARIIVAMLDDPDLTATEAGMRVRLSRPVGPNWVRRFNEEGVEGLQDRPPKRILVKNGRPVSGHL